MASAQQVLTKAGDGADGDVRPSSAAYLAHVALECVLKARLLYRNHCASVEDLQRKDPKAYTVIFVGKSGHDLQFIADKLRLPELMKLEGKGWTHDTCWRRIASSARPYSLRYGAEDVAHSSVAEELARASEIVTAVLAGTGRLPLNAPLGHRRR